MQSRFPDDNWEYGKTCAPYSVFQGFARTSSRISRPGLGKMTGTRVHGHLFAPDRVEFAGGEEVYNGALSDSAQLRDYNPQVFPDQPDLEHAGRAAVLSVRPGRSTGHRLVHRDGFERADFGHLRCLGGAAVPCEPEFRRDPADGGAASEDRGRLS